MKKMKWTTGLLGLAAMAVVFYMSALSCMAAEGKVTADTAKIRAKADTSSEVVGSTVKGKVIDILEAVKDSSGTVWYKVPIANNGYGYIRSDLVETSETLTSTASVASEEKPQSSSNTEESKPEETVPTSIGEQQATIKSDTSVRIRSGASTKHDAVTALPNGTAITLIGEATDSAGNKWYQLTCDYKGKKVEGYVRSDLITIGGTQETEEGAAEGEAANPEGEEADNPEGTEPEEGTEGTPEEDGEGEEPEEEPKEEHNDYEVVYKQNEAGEYEYYLYDNIEGTMLKLGDLLNVVDVANETNQKLQDQKEQDKIIIIILAVVIVILFVVITVLIFKIRDLYYADYDDEDEEEEDEEPAPVRKKVRKHEEEDYDEPAPVRKKRPVTAERPIQERPVQQRSSQPRPKPKERPDANGPQTRNSAPKPKPRKPQNFLVDDDEFEFEFLNMDDKDL